MEFEVRDSNGTLLNDGDTVMIIQSLKVKGGNDVKRGQMVKNIRLTNSDQEIEGKVEKTMMVLKTIYVKKV